MKDTITGIAILTLVLGVFTGSAIIGLALSFMFGLAILFSIIWLSVTAIIAANKNKPED